MKKPKIDMEAKRIMVDRQTYSDMIDALIDLIDVCPIEKEYQVKALEKGKQALKKAGVEL